ncbi:type II toxin-antitoxin system VapB family antitoxin [Dyadobacter sp. OTU695]|uniref:type II toxin-antitoxin system VapB family antitoxin n=1 Tax=Dyadobacter sp. OTU695 TaxID=3043860 RepID=UPI00313E0AE7
MDTQAIISNIEQLPEKWQQEAARYISSLKQLYAEQPKPAENLPPRQFGLHKGKYIMAPDFDEPLEDFKDYM